MWEKFDKMLAEVEDLAEITSRISRVLPDYYANKRTKHILSNANN